MLKNRIHKNGSKKSAELRGGVNFEAIKQELLQLVQNVLLSNAVVDLDYSLNTGFLLEAAPKYHAVKVSSPDRLTLYWSFLDFPGAFSEADTFHYLFEIFTE